MIHASRRAALATLLLLLALAPLGCGGEAPDAPKSGHGVIRGLDLAAGAITLEHGPIEGLMSAMTMTFALADPSLASGLAVGDEVDFSVREEGDRFVVTAIRASAGGDR
jgi:Cu/Ag efflux protein CusF